jgi:uncharacterized protein
MKILRYTCLGALLLFHVSAHATSFDCSKGRSVTERMICSNNDLSQLDDELGKLYWAIRRHTADRRAFIADSDSKWLWREHNCTDRDCLVNWYHGRIEELQRKAEGLKAGRLPQVSQSPLSQAASASATTHVAATPTSATRLSASRAVEPVEPLQCTAADPGLPVHAGCSTILDRTTGWRRERHDGSADWFCGLAMAVSSPVSD